MDAVSPRFYRDFVDPASYLVEQTLSELEVPVERIAFEIRRPPAPLIDPRRPEWRRYVGEMESRAEERGLPFRSPRIVPWSRKAHELVLHGRKSGAGKELEWRLFEAYFQEGRDIGRVDLLVELAAASGLDRTETKAVLDVDRYSSEVDEARAHAERRGVRGVPTLMLGDRVLEGFHPDHEIRTFLQRAHDS